MGNTKSLLSHFRRAQPPQNSPSSQGLTRICGFHRISKLYHYLWCGEFSEVVMYDAQPEGPTSYDTGCDAMRNPIMPNHSMWVKLKVMPHDMTRCKSPSDVLSCCRKPLRCIATMRFGQVINDCNAVMLATLLPRCAAASSTDRCTCFTCSNVAVTPRSKICSYAP